MSDDLLSLHLHDLLEFGGDVDFTLSMLSDQLLELVFLILEHDLGGEGLVEPKIDSDTQSQLRLLGLHELNGKILLK